MLIISITQTILKITSYDATDKSASQWHRTVHFISLDK